MDLKWWFWSRYPLFWYWCEQKSGWLWDRWSKDRPVYWFDFAPAFFARRYYRALNRMVKLTGRNIYGDINA